MRFSRGRLWAGRTKMYVISISRNPICPRDALMVQKLSRSSSAAVSDFGYDACAEQICLATNLPGLNKLQLK